MMISRRYLMTAQAILGVLVLTFGLLLVQGCSKAEHADDDHADNGDVSHDDDADHDDAGEADDHDGDAHDDDDDDANDDAHHDDDDADHDDDDEMMTMPRVGTASRLSSPHRKRMPTPSRRSTRSLRRSRASWPPGDSTACTQKRPSSAISPTGLVSLP